MANHGYGTFTKYATNESHIMDLLEEANKNHFGGFLSIEYDQQWNELVVKVGDVNILNCWLNDDGTVIEYKHCNGSSVGWYIDGFLTSYVVDKIGGYITDDGHDEVVEPTFYKRYPKYRDYLKMYYSGMNGSMVYTWLKVNLAWNKSLYPKDLISILKRK